MTSVRKPWLYTLLVVNTAFVVFRSKDLTTAVQMLGTMATLSGGSLSLSASWWWLLAGCLGVHLLQRRFPIHGLTESLPPYAFAAVFGVAIALLLPFATVGYVPFIYFQF